MLQKRRTLQMNLLEMFRNNPFRTIYFLFFSFESSESYCVFIFYTIRIRFFVPRELFPKSVFDGTVLETSIFASPRKESSAPGIKLSQNVMRGKRLLSAFFPHAVEIAQPNFTRKDTAADGTLRTLSWIDRAFIHLPVAEARFFHLLLSCD